MKDIPKKLNAVKSPVFALSKKYDLLIGIDPGTNTGVAMLHVSHGMLGFVGSVMIHQAFAIIEGYTETGMKIKVYIEDSRNVSRAFGGAAKAQGAGSIKRDCNIWEDYLIDSGIDYQFIRPGKRSNLKMESSAFAKLTGWKGRTNSHGRDAAMLVFGRTTKTETNV